MVDSKVESTGATKVVQTAVWMVEAKVARKVADWVHQMVAWMDVKRVSKLAAESAAKKVESLVDWKVVRTAVWMVEAKVVR